MKQSHGWHGRFQSIPFKERFLEKVQKAGDDECWTWTGASYKFTNRNYIQGHIRDDNGKTTTPSRAAWVIFRGEIPTGLHILHKCDNPLCVNPNHLFLGTNSDNIADRVRKGRSTLGEKDGYSKLTRDQVISIQKTTGSAAPIAKEYGISTTHVCLIRRKGTWLHLWKDEESGLE